MDASVSTSSSLIREVQQGDPVAWDRFALLYAPLVHHWLRRLGLQPVDAADVCQNVFICVLRGLPNFQLDQPAGGLRAWLRTITRHTLIDWHRKRGRQLPTEQLDAWEEVAGEGSRSSITADDERSLLLQRAAEQIQEEFESATWQSFHQLCVEGRSAEQIASERGVSVWTVYKAKARILTRFRELLGDYL